MDKILLIEDDRHLSIKLKEALQKWQFQVIIDIDFNDCLTTFSESYAKLVIMDIGLPTFDGFYWCNKIREISSVPILFLSSRDSDKDIVMAMNMGGDDFLTKPFSMDVLIAKINAMMRRAYGYTELQEPVLTFKGLHLYLNRSQILYEEVWIDLTRNELRILTLLLEHKNKIVSRAQMMRALWDDDQFVNENTLTVNINRLRHKLEALLGTDYIQTKKGLGYMLIE
ncbi:MAG: response regulator transcription factor [Vallitaleaceae bacterium]|jgi:DNA-binding response OmpR family regulator|nr:response regulator transcription factor [Vallitaleaceae bacterium]